MSDEIFIDGKAFILRPIYFYNGQFYEEPAVDSDTGQDGFYGYVLVRKF